MFGATHKGKKADDKVSMSAENQKCSATEVLVCLKCFTLLHNKMNSVVDDISVLLHY